MCGARSTSVCLIFRPDRRSAAKIQAAILESDIWGCLETLSLKLSPTLGENPRHIQFLTIDESGFPRTERPRPGLKR
jgi:hypothetical protein